jgi:hypothetical protein
MMAGTRRPVLRRSLTSCEESGSRGVVVMATMRRVHRGSKGRTAPEKPAAMALTGTTVTLSPAAASWGTWLVTAVPNKYQNGGLSPFEHSKNHTLAS